MRSKPKPPPGPTKEQLEAQRLANQERAVALQQQKEASIRHAKAVEKQNLLMEEQATAQRLAKKKQEDIRAAKEKKLAAGTLGQGRLFSSAGMRGCPLSSLFAAAYKSRQEDKLGGA